MVLPCPLCKSTKTLSSLRRKLRKVTDRIAEEKRRVAEEKRTAAAARRKAAAALAAKTAKVGVTIGTINHGSGLGTLNYSPHNHTLISNSIGATTIQLGQIGRGQIANDDELDLVVINGMHLETCADCGMFYAPNAKTKATEIETETWELDPLGALAEIYDEDEAPVVGRSSHG